MATARTPTPSEMRFFALHTQAAHQKFRVFYKQRRKSAVLGNGHDDVPALVQIGQVFVHQSSRFSDRGHLNVGPVAELLHVQLVAAQITLEHKS